VEFDTFCTIFVGKMKEIMKLVLSPKSYNSSQKDELRKVKFKPMVE